MSAPRTALVTGGARGIGRAIARELLRRGRRVVLTYHADAAGAEAALAELAPLGPVSAARLDVRDGAACEALVAELGGIDVLVNNAGVVTDQFLRFADAAAWDAMLATNTTGAFHACRAVLPGMQARGWGRVVNISSYVGRHGAEGRSGYAASKAALLGLTRSLAREAAPAGVTVNAVCPGLILTERTRQYAERVQANTIARVPLGRAGEPDEVGTLVAYLSSDEAGYITGQTWSIDGGLAMKDGFE
jgi:NAD(P)-dependent dehydrogenase (short-subunit alcohol dehydrogenase family)